MLIDFFFTLRDAKVPVSIKEFLTLLEALEKDVIAPCARRVLLPRAPALVKDEAHFDKFDKAFGAYFKGVETVFDRQTRRFRSTGCMKRLERELTPEQKAEIEKMGWDKLMETLPKRLEEQKERHEGGNKWIGTGGTSPFGNGGYNPRASASAAQASNSSAVKVWDQRAYKDYDDTLELGTRNIKVALRRLRRFAREGAADELDAGRHHPLHRRQRRLARHQDAARAPQQRQGAAAAGRRRHDGRPHPARRGAVLGRQDRVQAPGVLLLPQLRLRLHVEEQPAPLQRRASRPGT